MSPSPLAEQLLKAGLCVSHAMPATCWLLHGKWWKEERKEWMDEPVGSAPWHRALPAFLSQEMWAEQSGQK